MQRQYRDYLSEFKKWKKLPHAKDWLIFPENIGKRLSIDEVALSQGELYTVITNKKAKGRAGSIVAIIKGTVSVVYEILNIVEDARKVFDNMFEMVIPVANINNNPILSEGPLNGRLEYKVSISQENIYRIRKAFYEHKFYRNESIKFGLVRKWIKTISNMNLMVSLMRRKQS